MSAQNREVTKQWSTHLRDLICSEFEKIEAEYTKKAEPLKFTRTSWQRNGGGGGVVSILKGEVFEKVGVNISTVFGELSNELRSQIPGTNKC